MSRTSLPLLCLSALALGACAPLVASMPVTAELPPAEMPDYPLGSQWEGLDDGALATHTLVRANAESRSFESTTGCSWTEPVNFLGPALAWDDCGRQSGSQHIDGTTGAIWPLQVGKTQSWSTSGTDEEGRTWQATYRCVVISAEQIDVAAGTFDTYKVTCEDLWITETRYYAPSLSDTVLYIRIDKSRGLEERWQYLSGPTRAARVS